jgi:tRNA threonylcarbamoyladenosine biosynthesis protein TsaB
MILALQTDGPTTHIGLLPGKLTSWESERRLADELLARIRDLAKDQGKAINDLTGIIIFSGPGSFTSLRIGHTVANVLAESLNIPIVGARGDDWLDVGQKALPKAKPGQPVWPFYGADPNVTRPKA